MDPSVLREDMVDSLEHEAKGLVGSESVGVAMRSVPREAFVGDERGAYQDRADERLGTRVLAPSTVARLLEALAPEPGDDVLVVGAGVGYTAAVVAEIAGAANVQAIDIDRRLVWEARSNLAEAGYDGVLVDRRDGADGFEEYAPYDRILVEAAAVEPPRALVEQLAPGGRLVMPLGATEQSLVAVAPDDGRDGAPDDGQVGVADAGRGGTGEEAQSGTREEAQGDTGEGARGGAGDGERAGAGEVVERFGPTRFEPMLVRGEEATTVERNRTIREDRERAAQAAERRTGWEHEWLDWDERLGGGGDGRPGGRGEPGAGR